MHKKAGRYLVQLRPYDNPWMIGHLQKPWQDRSLIDPIVGGIKLTLVPRFLTWYSRKAGKETSLWFLRVCQLDHPPRKIFAAVGTHVLDRLKSIESHKADIWSVLS